MSGRTWLPALLLLLVGNPLSARAWQAYNDLCRGTNETTDTQYVTDWTAPHGKRKRGQSGPLKRYWTGAPLPVTVTIKGGGLSPMGTAPNRGTDAYKTFGGILDCTGTIDYDIPVCTLTFRSLDPATRYTFAIFGCRGEKAHAKPGQARVTKMTITNAAVFVNASTPGAWISGRRKESTTITNGYNMQGWVARWSGIQTGYDGSFSVICEAVTKHGLYLTAFKLETDNVPEPLAILTFAMTLGLFQLARTLRVLFSP